MKSNQLEKTLAATKALLEKRSAEEDKAFVKLTSAARGYLGRQRVKRIQNFKKADETGVLVALKNTKQGETGWYAGPNGGIFYFVLKDVSRSTLSPLSRLI
jgi:hypothetical protein